MKKFLFASVLLIFCFGVAVFPQEKQPKVIKYFASAYPPAAKAVKATGEVVVAVKITKDGKVTLAKAESGHPLLRQVSENAAMKWIFSIDKNVEERTVKITFAFKIEDEKDKRDKIKFTKPYRLEYISRKSPTIDF
jgi:TonB family protein